METRHVSQKSRIHFKRGLQLQCMDRVLQCVAVSHKTFGSCFIVIVIVAGKTWFQKEHCSVWAVLQCERSVWQHVTNIWILSHIIAASSHTSKKINKREIQKSFTYMKRDQQKSPKHIWYLCHYHSRRKTWFQMGRCWARERLTFAMLPVLQDVAVYCSVLQSIAE